MKYPKCLSIYYESELGVVTGLSRDVAGIRGSFRR